MEALRLKENNYEPEVIFDKGTEEFILRGGGAYEYGFFDPLFEWIDKYVKNPNKKTVVTFQLNYWNTALLQPCLKIIRKFGEVVKNGGTLEVHWYYPEGDIDAEEDSEDLAIELSDIPFKIIPYKK